MSAPESCGSFREGWGEVLTGVHAGRAIERRKFHLECRGPQVGRRPHNPLRYGEKGLAPRRRRTQVCMQVCRRDPGRSLFNARACRANKGKECPNQCQE